MPRILRYPGGVLPSAGNDNVVIIPDSSPIIGKRHSSLSEADSDEFKELTVEDYEQAAYFIKEQAEKEAEALLARSQAEAEELIANANAEASSIVLAARDEAELILAQARAAGERDGYEAAFLQQTNDISACLSEAHRTLEEIRVSQDEYISSCADEVGKLSLEIAGEILQHDIDTDPLALYDLVERAVGSLKDARWVVLSLSKKLVPLIELLQSELPAKCPTIGHLEIAGKDMPDGNCTIDSTDGLIDASIETQLKILERRFAQVSQKLKEG